MLKGSITEKISLKRFGEAQRLGLQAAGRYWHERFAPLHFLMSAMGRYGYQERKGADSSQKFHSPIMRVSKSGHATFSELAEGPDGVVRTVTTNFLKRTGQTGRGARWPRGTKYAIFMTGHGWRTTHGEFGYTLQKQRKFGHRMPLVWKGGLREAVMETVNVQEATPAMVKVRMKTPKWFKGFTLFRGASGENPDMRKELLTIIPAERAAMAGEMKREMVRKLGIKN